MDDSENNYTQQIKISLNKPYSIRTPSQKHQLRKFINKLDFFKHCESNLGPQFIKGIIKNAYVELISINTIVCAQGQPIDNLMVVLEGQLGILGDNKFNLQNPQKNEIVIMSLTNLACQMYKNKKNRKKIRRKISFLKNNKTNIYNYSSIIEFISPYEEYGSAIRCSGQLHRHNVISLEPTTLLVINFEQILFWFHYCAELRKSQHIELIQKINCFKYIQNQLLVKIIEAMKKQTVKSNGIIYEQGESSHSIYILLKGQVQIKRNVNLFKENPNSIYVDRRTFFTKKEQKTNNNAILPYADFTTVYNYHPMQKILQIGILTPIVLFGEQQLLENKKRQVSAVCNSLECEYYHINIDSIRQILLENYDNFIQNLKNSVKQKILHRQNILANNLNIENSNKISCFYNENSKNKLSLKKFRISKINNSFIGGMNPENKVVINQKKSLQQRTPVKAFYDTFNFHQMKKLTEKNIKQEKISNKSTLLKLYFEPKESRVEEMNQLQSKIYTDSHTWREVGRHVQQERQFSRKTNLQQQLINLDHPLIDETFFRKIQQANRKIEQYKRNGLGIKIKKRNKTIKQKINVYE